MFPLESSECAADKPHPQKKEEEVDTGHIHANPMLKLKREKYHPLSVQNTAMYTTFRMAIW